MSEAKPLETVLVATDFSTSADGAIRWAGEVARPHGARVVVVHASMPPAPLVSAPEFVAIPPEVFEADRERVRNELDAKVKELTDSGLNAVGKHGDGGAVDVILDAAERESADLIVVGTRGLTGAKRVFLGSTAAHVVRNAPCPVLTVHPGQADEHRPLRTVLIPTDYSDDAELAVAEAVRLLGATKAEAKLKLLHVYRLQPEVVYPWTPGYLGARSAEIAAEATGKLEGMAEPLRSSGFDVEVLVAEGFPPDVIDETARRTNADVIAMGTHGRSFFSRLVLGSVAERVLPAAPCPVLTVHHPRQD